MYGFADDKGKFNLGSWGGFAVSKEKFKIGALSDNSVVSGSYPDKYVAEIPVSSLSKYCQLVTKETFSAMPIVAETSGSIYSATALVEVSESEKLAFEMVETVYVQNETIYFIAKTKPIKDLVFVIKGA